MDDQGFLQAFESGKLSPHEFPHQAHIRMAFLVLRRDGWEAGFENIRMGIQRFARAHGATRKYHVTITCFWALLVYHALTLDDSIEESEVFIAAYPHLLDTGLIQRHYSRDLLMSDAARAAWVEPDLEPFPADMVR